MSNSDQQAAFIEAGLKLKARAAQNDFAPPSDRRQRALQTCHRYTLKEPVRKAIPRSSRGYVPELAARLDDDPNLTDGARRCARKIAEVTYRSQREGRCLPVTVSFLSRAMGRCRRTVQRYLRQLEREGYIVVEVVAGQRSRMCIGLVVKLMAKLFAAHHQQRWPETLGKPGATTESQNHNFYSYRQREGQRIPVGHWALRCMDGVFRSFMATDPLSALKLLSSPQ